MIAIASATAAKKEEYEQWRSNMSKGKSNHLKLREIEGKPIAARAA
ncbi:hypothetical protein [Collimonas humicola]|nr:hypothetical protein [Collimonas humicola]